ncbi:unnamed protein product [Urochloa decumbens]|uniref:Ubiquitin-like domain-containing protein n=2 Tax=Urochloa decumbens TaxID=240449 RepID=A0ABC9GEY6_9POAL
MKKLRADRRQFRPRSRNWVAVGAYDMDLDSLVPELQALEHEPSNSSISQIFIRSCNGISLLNMDLRGATVETLKHVVEEREGIPVVEQYMILNGHKPLRDGTLLTDYDAFGGQATIEVFSRIRGGKPMTELLPIFAICNAKSLSADFRFPDGTVHQHKVLTPLGVRILRGIMSCFLAAHQAELAYNGSLKIGHLVVSGFSRDGVIVPETAAVRISSAVSIVFRTPEEEAQKPETSSTPETDQKVEIRTLTPEGQKADYGELFRIIGSVFRDKIPLHAQTIHARLGNFSAAVGNLPAKITQLLQAFVAMADPLVMATMWWNLVRFADSLGPPEWLCVRDPATRNLNWVQQRTTQERQVFNYAVDLVLPVGSSWENSVTSNLQFRNNIKGRNYRYWAATDLLRFARNWFTHAPEAQGNEALTLGPQAGQTPLVAQLPDLDYYFSSSFHEFMASVLEHLYIKGHFWGVRCDDLTRVLVPPS